MVTRYLVLAASVACLVAPCTAALSATSPSSAAAPAETEHLQYLDPAEFAPARLLPPPPPRGSLVEAQELANLKAIIAAATPQRLAQAKADGTLEESAAFNAAAGIDIAKLPATKALLDIIQEETEQVSDSGKLYFARVRPYGIDPTLPHCGNGGNAAKSYPSGHAGFAWSVGWALVRLIPDKAEAIVARAQDYAFSREVCGVHFASDIEASHVIVGRPLITPVRISRSPVKSVSTLTRLE